MFGGAWQVLSGPSVRDSEQVVATYAGPPALAYIQVVVLQFGQEVAGGEDVAVIQLNRRAMASMRCLHELKIIPGATHLFEENGALEKVAALAADWFLRFLP